jgi:hypothetical protein
MSPSYRERVLQSQLPYRNLDAIVSSVSARFFQRRNDDVTWRFVIQKTLANITSESRHIQIHNVLNAGDVPEFVFVTIIFHEMLHLEIPPKELRKGVWKSHHDEFWEAEKKRSPDYEASWQWLYGNLPLRRRPRLECTDVVPGLMRLTKQQRAWARERFGVELPRAIRSDDPSSRTMATRAWLIAVQAHSHSENNR